MLCGSIRLIWFPAPCSICKLNRGDTMVRKCQETSKHKGAKCPVFAHNRRDCKPFLQMDALMVCWPSVPPNDLSLIAFQFLLIKRQDSAPGTVNKFVQRRKTVIMYKMSAYNWWRLTNQLLDCEPLQGWERMDRSTSCLKKKKQLQAANWKALWEASLPFVCLLPPLLKVLACRCLFSFLVLNYKDGRMVQRDDFHEALYCRRHTRSRQLAGF